MRHFSNMERSAMWIGAALFSLAGCSFPVDDFTPPSGDAAVDSFVAADSSPSTESGTPDAACDHCGGTACVNLATDPKNCGTCDHACISSKEKCVAKMCMPK